MLIFNNYKIRSTTLQSSQIIYVLWSVFWSFQVLSSVLAKFNTRLFMHIILHNNSWQTGTDSWIAQIYCKFYAACSTALKYSINIHLYEITFYDSIKKYSSTCHHKPLYLLCILHSLPDPNTYRGYSNWIYCIQYFRPPLDFDWELLILIRKLRSYLLENKRRIFFLPFQSTNQTIQIEEKNTREAIFLHFIRVPCEYAILVYFNHKFLTSSIFTKLRTKFNIIDPS